ncbi:MAG: cysteine desulfurase [Sphingobacteriales bacterium]|jgi:cysteine desulfurase
MKVFLDNAATTPIDSEVVKSMTHVLENVYGNPSSTHSLGRKARACIETARKEVAALLHTAPSTIFFTSGGTEADNTAIRCGIDCYDIKHAITSATEHHAVLYPLQALEKEGKINLSYVNICEDGHVDLDHLRELLATNERSFVSLMHANNEIGSLMDLKKAGEICKEYDALFHSDTVQTMGHYAMDLEDLNIDFLTCSAHKLHGPKGIGFLYINPNIKINPFIYGGSQERNQRGGTENIYGIVGLAKSLSLAYEHMEEHHNHIQGLKNHMIEKLKMAIPGVAFNGDINPEKSLYTVLNVCLPQSDMGEMLLFNLDIAGICASGGSACSSGTDIGSHVLQALGDASKRPNVRFSFSRLNTIEEIDYTVEKLASLFPVNA